MARPTPQSRGDCPSLSVANSSWQYRVPPSPPLIGLTLQRLSLLPSPYEVALSGPGTPLGTRGAVSPVDGLGGRTLAWASHLLRRWLRVLHARYPCLARGVRPAGGTTARLWLSRGAAPGTVPCWHGVADATRSLSVEHARVVSRPKDTSRLGGRGRARRGPGPVVLCPYRLTRAGWCARHDAGRSATNCRFSPPSALCHARDPTDTRNQRPAPLEVAPSLWTTGPTGGVVQTQILSSVARSRDL